jgi:septum site-determining protein MinD
VVSHRKYPSLDLLAAPVTDGRLPYTPQQMGKLFRMIRASYDYCLVDAPAGLGLGFHMAVDYADSAVVVTTTDQSALRDAQRTVMELSRFPSGKVHLVVGRVQRKMLHALHTTIDDAIDTAGLPLLGVIPEDRDLTLALNRGIPLRDCNDYAARAYDNIAKRIAGRRVPLMRI